MMGAPERRRLRFRVPVRSLALLVIVIVGGSVYPVPAAVMVRAVTPPTARASACDR